MRSNAVEIVIPGCPVPKGRARSAVIHGRVVHYTPKPTKDYESLARSYAMQAMAKRKVMDGPVFLAVRFYLPIPESWSKKKKESALCLAISPITKPDLSNLVKAVEDAMNGVVWRDDSQVTCMQVEKFYSDEPRSEVTVKEMNEDGQKEK